MNISLRGIDPATKVKLEEQARIKNISLNKYINNILDYFALNPEIRTIDEKYKQFIEKIMSILSNNQNTNKELILENIYLLRRIENILDKLGEQK